MVTPPFQEWVSTINQWRSSNNLTLKEVARRIDKPYNTVRRWLSDHDARDPGWRIRQEVLDRLEINYLFDSAGATTLDTDNYLQYTWKGIQRKYQWAQLTSPEESLPWLYLAGLLIHTELCKHNIPVFLQVSPVEKPCIVYRSGDNPQAEAQLQLYPSEPGFAARYGYTSDPMKPISFLSDIEVDDRLIMRFIETCHECRKFSNSTTSEGPEASTEGAGAFSGSSTVRDRRSPIGTTDAPGRTRGNIRGEYTVAELAREEWPGFD